MFFSKKDTTLAFTQGEDFFHYAGEKVAFNTVMSLYDRGVANFTNSVYEKRDLYITLIFNDDERLELKADTQDMQAFILLSNLYEELVNFRAKKITTAFKEEKKMIFRTLNSELRLVFEKETLRVVYSKAKRRHSKDFEVKEITQISHYFSLKGESEDESVVSWMISDTTLFRVLANTLVGVRVAEHTKGEEIFLKYFKILFVIFGINGMSELWLKTSFFSHTQMIEIPSLIAGMLLSLWIFLSPMHWLVSKLNSKRMRREAAELRGEDVGGREYRTDYSNLLLFVLVIGLGIFIYKSYF